MAFYNPGDVIFVRLPFQENPLRGKPRPVLVVSIEDDRTYKVLKITSKDKSHIPECIFISKDSSIGNSMGIKIDSYIDKGRVLTLPASLIVDRDSPWGEYPEIDDLIEDLGID